MTGMPLLQRTRVLWTGFLGAPGYTNLYARFVDAETTPPINHAEDVATLFTALRARMPRAVNVQIEQEVAIVDEDTGDIAGFQLLPFAPPVEGNGVLGNWSAASGAAIEWRTSAVRSGRRLTGRTFVVPLAASAYDSDGTLVEQANTDIQLAANNYISESASEPVVWSRPRDGRLGWAGTIQQARVRDRVAVLRSRRD